MMVNATSSSETVIRIALIRNSSVAKISRVSARWKSADTADRSPLLPRSPSIDALLTMRMSYSASIERAAEARHGDDHRQQHQCNECNRVVLQILDRRAFQHDGTHDANVMRQRQPLAEILRPDRHSREWKHESGQQNARQEEHHRQLHRLQLVLHDG